MNAESMPEEKLTPTELAQQFADELTQHGYTLGEKADVSRQLRRLLRTETEEAQKQLATIYDGL